MNGNGHWMHKDSNGHWVRKGYWDKQERTRARQRKQEKYAEAQRKKWLKTCTKGELIKELWGKLWR